MRYTSLVSVNLEKQSISVMSVSAYRTLARVRYSLFLPQTLVSILIFIQTWVRLYIGCDLLITTVAR